MSAGFAEADEILGIQDGPDDYACPFHFATGSTITKSWNKRTRPGESDADSELRRYSADVDYPEDYKQVQAISGSIKVVGRIDYCEKGDGQVNLKTTRYLGCSFRNGTFMIARDALADWQLRGVVLAHEYGHNVCNTDTSEPGQVMHGSAAAENRKVTPEQCKKYLAPKGSFCKHTLAPPRNPPFGRSP